MGWIFIYSRASHATMKVVYSPIAAVPKKDESGQADGRQRILHDQSFNMDYLRAAERLRESTPQPGKILRSTTRGEGAIPERANGALTVQKGSESVVIPAGRTFGGSPNLGQSYSATRIRLTPQKMRAG